MAIASAGSKDGTRVESLTRALIAHDAWSRDRLSAYQRDRLRSLLRHAVQASPYYRDVLPPDADGDVPLGDLPTLSKETYLENFNLIATDPRLQLADVDAHWSGPDGGRPFQGEYQILTTSGTSGVRGVFAYTAEEMAIWSAAHVRMLHRFGITPVTRVAAIGSPNPLHLTKRVFAVLQQGPSEAPRLSVRTPIPEIVETLNAYRPEAGIGYASIWGMLADEQLRGRLRIRPRIIALGGEPITVDVRARIRAAWQIEPGEAYAATEAPLIAQAPPGQAGLEINEDLFVIEVVDEAHRPVPAGRPGYKVLVTSLAARTMPLIRYELSDSVTLADGGNPYGRAYRRITRIEGRSEDIIRLPGRAGDHVDILPRVFVEAVEGCLDVYQYQIRHDAQGLHVLVVLRPGAAPGAPADIGAAVIRELEAAGAVPPPVEVVPVDQIRRVSGPGAKFKLIDSGGSA